MLFFSFLYEKLCKESGNNSDITLYVRYFDDFVSWGSDKLRDLKAAIEGFAEYIIENFLLPFRASSVKTPQPTPASLSSFDTSTVVSSRQCISTLRQSCLVRDHHRCVISRKFDRCEAEKRFEQDGEDCKDDDGKLLRDESNDRFQFLEVAHILPHSLTAVLSGEMDLVCGICNFKFVLLTWLYRVIQKKMPSEF